MCFNQFMVAYGWELLLSLLSGLVTGVLTSYVVTLLFKNKEMRELSIQKANDLEFDCQLFLDLTNKLIDQLALRKFQTYHIANSLKNMDGEKRRLVRIEETTKVNLSEVSKGTLTMLCIKINGNKFEGRLRTYALKRFDAIVTEVDSCISAIDDLGNALENFSDFSSYFADAESSASEMDYEAFINCKDDIDKEFYKPIINGRINLKKNLSKLIRAIVAVNWLEGN